MEQRFGSDSIPSSGSFNKNKVLNVRPSRCLVPIFASPPGMSSSSSPQTAPFICAPPTGPFPPGFNSFYPFFFLPNSQNLDENSQNPFGGTFGFNSVIASPMPISSFKTPPAGPANGDSGPSRKRAHTNQNQNGQILSGFSIELADGDVKDSRRKRNKQIRPGENKEFEPDVDGVANNFLSSFDLTVFDSAGKSDGDKEMVNRILMIMNFLRRMIMQIEDSKDVNPGTARRPDLRAGAILMNKGLRTNMTKRVGVVPGVEVGDIFFFRMELCLVGMHAPSMGGIDYMNLKINQTEEPIAISIVSSGGYENNIEDTDVLIYSGQGGNANQKDKYIDVSDQKLEKGNLALEKSLHHGNEVRVIRGLRENMTPRSGNIYLYDGLYKVQESWIEKGKSGFNIFKYKLFRLPGQPQGLALWKAIQQWKEGVGSRPEVILPDLTSGAEILPVSVVNEVDDEKGPAYFTYYPSLKYPRPLNLPRYSSCSCRSACQTGDPNCPCVQLNGGSLPYSALGVLMSFKSIIHECGSSCLCSATCRNRVTQAGLKFRLEVFKTRDKGWGLRSWEPIRSGAFICEYAGEVIDKPIEEQFGRNDDDNYIFDSTRRFEPHEIMLDDSDGPPKLPFPLVISAKNIGNVARFMNHSCSPNVYWQPAMRERDNENYLHVIFFAINNIPPMRELTFDYGVIPGNAEHRRKKCSCGSLKCRGYFY